MKRVTVAGRCLTCWTLNWAETEIVSHLPSSFKIVCRSCKAERLHALTGQLVPTLSPAALKEIKAAHKEKRAVRWEQIPMALDLTGRALDGEIEREVDPLATRGGDRP